MMADSNHKKARTSQEAWDVQERFEGKAHGWIQWKGTAVCMDIYCICGVHLHADEDFLYHVKCLHCGRIYFVNGHVELIELTDEKTPNCLKSLQNDLMVAEAMVAKKR